VKQEKVTLITGKLYYKIFLAGANKILENQKLLNQINVFPVPDADTGTNLASTLRAVIDNAQPHESFSNTANAIAVAALNGARGNSGVIFAQFLYGMSTEVGQHQSLTIDHFSACIKNAVNYVYEAVAEPLEGTMLTVIREWAEFIDAHKDKFDDFIRLFLHAYDIATKTLSNTTAMLPSLKLANVVDAGAKGFVLFLEGILEGLKKKNGKREIVINHKTIEPVILKSISHENFNYRFCTEAIIKSEFLDKSLIKTSISDLGDSLVIAGSDKILRLHIHTDSPHILFDRLRQFGTLSYQKADDMKKQSEIASDRKWNIALVTDSTSDLPIDLIDFYQINVIPLNIHFGENEYLDKVTIQSEQFFNLIEKEKTFPTTSQPNETAFRNLYAYLCTHFDSVIAVHISDKFSGTMRNSVKAALQIEKESGKKITVLDSQHVSGSLGLQTLRIAHAIEAGKSHDEIISEFISWREKSRIFVSVKNLKYMVRGGRVSATKGFVAKMLNVKPIVSMDSEGNSSLFDKAYTQKANMRKVMKHINNFLQGNKVWNYIILHAESEETAQWYITEMKKLTGKDPVSLQNISPVIGLSAGKGTAAIALMAE
jgi:DegV family protein with EDD domain